MNTKPAEGSRWQNVHHAELVGVVEYKGGPGSDWRLNYADGSPSSWSEGSMGSNWRPADDKRPAEGSMWKNLPTGRVAEARYYPGSACLWCFHDPGAAGNLWYDIDNTEYLNFWVPCDEVAPVPDIAGQIEAALVTLRANVDRAAEALRATEVAFRDATAEAARCEAALRALRWEAETHEFVTYLGNTTFEDTITRGGAS